MGTVISGTMRPEDLIPALLEELERRDPERAGIIREDVEELTLVEEPEYGVYYSDRDEVRPGISSRDWAPEVVEELFCALDDCAPEGCYFGAHPGDGCDYGFWEEEVDL